MTIIRLQRLFTKRLFALYPMNMGGYAIHLFEIAARRVWSFHFPRLCTTSRHIFNCAKLLACTVYPCSPEFPPHRAIVRSVKMELARPDDVESSSQPLSRKRGNALH